MTEERVSPNQIINFSELRTEIELLKKDVSFIKTLFDKMDRVIEKIETQHEVLFNKTSSVIDEKFNSTKDEVSELYETIENTKKLINDRVESIEQILRSEIKEVDTTLTTHKKEYDEYVGKINNLVYGIGAVALFIGWIVTNIDFVKKIFN